MTYGQKHGETTKINGKTRQLPTGISTENNPVKMHSARAHNTAKTTTAIYDKSYRRTA